MFHFDATEFFNLIDWDIFSEPSLTMDLSNKELLEIAKKGETVLCEKAEIPCHFQAVKTVSGVALAVCSKEKRDGLIRVKLNSRSKKDFILG
jgi:hypothetical protein